MTTIPSSLILVLNCGSSSIKFALYESNSKQPVARQSRWRGRVNNICDASPECTISGSPTQILPAFDAEQPYQAAVQYVLALARQQRSPDEHLRAVAHRVVHGGRKYARPALLTPQVLADLHSYVPLAPLHQPYALQAIEAVLAIRPDLAQVVCFDTAFHSDLPIEESLLPLDWDAWERGIHRYGFHGLSYDYMSIALPERHGDLARGRTLVAHIGSGASLCAMRNLKSVATTMGFSSLDGLMMGTRPGAIDPGVLLHLLMQEGRSLDDVRKLLYRGSGLKGISGISDDTRALLEHEATNPRAKHALALYINRMAREITAMVTALGGLDMLVFTAGVGENNPTIRERVCQKLAWMGVELDAQANANNQPIISAAGSRITVAVEPTNEEWIAAEHTRALLAAAQ